jgi:hypothetical protein
MGCLRLYGDSPFATRVLAAIKQQRQGRQRKMTKLNNAIEILTVLVLYALTAAAQSNKPKVVFIGDQFTFNWSSAFAANPNWINEGWGSPLNVNCYYTCGAGTSGATLNRFKTDVIDLHPAIVHIMVGVDDANFDDDADEQLAFPAFLKNLEQMVKLAKAASVQVVIGIESPEWGGLRSLEPINSIIANLAAQNNIPVINYADALCACVSSTGGYITSNSYMVPNSAPNTFNLIPSVTGYALMTQLAEVAVNTLDLTLRSGYIQNVQQQDDDQGTLVPPSVVRHTDGHL